MTRADNRNISRSCKETHRIVNDINGDMLENKKPKLLDTFCGAGGAGMGYHRAGFDVVGVDIEPQPRYPFEFHQGDALEFIERYGSDFDVIHASPPCQAYSIASKSWNGKPDNHPDLIEPVRTLLQLTNKPYVIENVHGAPLKNPIMLCGSMFPGLRVIRHRLFETLPVVWFPPASCFHPLCYTVDKRKKHYGKLDEMKSFVQVNGGGNCSVLAASNAMGIDWMTKSELNDAIPPAYTKWIGEQLLKQLCHPTNANNWWMPHPFDKSKLPGLMHSHPFYGLERVE